MAACERLVQLFFFFVGKLTSCGNNTTASSTLSLGVCLFCLFVVAVVVICFSFVGGGEGGHRQAFNKFFFPQEKRHYSSELATGLVFVSSSRAPIFV